MGFERTEPSLKIQGRKDTFVFSKGGSAWPGCKASKLQVLLSMLRVGRQGRRECGGEEEREEREEKKEMGREEDRERERAVGVRPHLGD